MKLKNYFIYTILLILLNGIDDRTYGQVYIFVGDPQIVLEAGTYKQNYNTGMYFFYKRNWDLAIEMFLRCSQLTRKRDKHFSALTWSYIYSGQFVEAIRSISYLNNRKEKQLIRLVLKKVTSLRKNNKLSKKDIDRIVSDKKDIIKRTRTNIVAMSKHEIIDYGP
jgi:hypothetical protein